MTKTIKQIAEELGVSKTAVRKKIANLGLQSSLQKNGNQFAIGKEQETLIKSAFEKKKSETANQKPVSDKMESLQLVSDMVSVLKEQLAEKDKQIETLQSSLKSTTEALIAAQESVRAAQLLQANAEQKARVLELKAEEPHKKALWKFRK